jgi:hypothetical protein
MPTQEVTKNSIIQELFTSKEFNDCIKKMQPVELQDDLKAEVALILCEHSAEKIMSIYTSSGMRGIKFYTVRIILNLIQSNTSPFYKKYRQPVYEFSDVIHDIKQQEDINEDRIEAELKEQEVLNVIDEMYWYDKEMIKLYLETGSYREMQRVTGIPSGSCYDTIQMSINKIRYELRRKHK